MQRGDGSETGIAAVDDAPPSTSTASRLSFSSTRATATANRLWTTLAARRQPAREDRSRPSGRIAEDHRLLHVAFAFAAGIALYFQLPAEPSLALLLCLAGGGLLAATVAHRQGRLPPAALLALALFCGVAAGAWRTASVAAPVLELPRSATLTGRVIERVPTAAGSQLVMELSSAEGLGRQAMPRRVRLSLRGTSGGDLLPGEGVRLRARLLPPSGPVRPGGYDFAFAAYFRGIGATGFVFGAPERIDLGPPGAWLSFMAAIQKLRIDVAQEADAALGKGDESAISAALLVGLRGEISRQAEADLREAGLSHVLSISGLHMALFAGGMYAVVLGGLALFPTLALRLPISRFAAAAALLAATCYLLLSGASIATQRSYLMIGLVFIGLMTGRRGLSLRSVALSGLLLLALRPEELFAPGFQMSYAAVICLIAAYGDYGRWSRARAGRRRPSDHGLLRHLVHRLWTWGCGISATSLIAGLATGIIAAHHFDRLAPYGLLGNLLAMPAVSMVIMPAGVAAFLMQPLGLAAPALTVMGQGIAFMLAAASFTASLSDSDGVIGQLPALAGLLLTVAVFWAFLAEGLQRLLAVGPALVGLILWGLDRPPDIYVSDRGTQIAARDRDGTLRITGGRIGFSAEVWLTGEGVPERRFASHRQSADQASCDPLGCVVAAYPPARSRSPAGSLMDTGPAKGKTLSSHPPPLHIAMPRKPDALESDCLAADILVTGLTAPPNCTAPLILDGGSRRLGGAALWLETVAGETRVSHIRYSRPGGTRPWQLPVTGPDPDAPR